MEVNEDNPGCDRHCANCRTTSTPLWRKFGPVKFLCNACGLYYKVNGDHRPYYMSKNKLNSSAKKSLLRCANCGTNKTTMWRKNGNLHVCNACGLYFRINGHNRPITMRKDVIRTRRRRDTAAFEMLDQMETCDVTNNGPMLSDLKQEDLPEHSYKMMLNISREHSLVLANNGDNQPHPHPHPHHPHHHLTHYADQHVCAETPSHHGHHHSEPGTLSPSQLINTSQIDANNGYYCPFF